MRKEPKNFTEIVDSIVDFAEKGSRPELNEAMQCVEVVLMGFGLEARLLIGMAYPMLKEMGIHEGIVGVRMLEWIKSFDQLEEDMGIPASDQVRNKFPFKKD